MKDITAVGSMAGAQNSERHLGKLKASLGQGSDAPFKDPSSGYSKLCIRLFGNEFSPRDYKVSRERFESVAYDGTETIDDR